ncbi:hypothetical protein I315_01427 [Cryptococcus gattii Ru294]|uniref:Uncharacterized protein n=2 Tax=Cryptococcus gattii TaxID=37769 RepID=E6R3H7_CRYGW|nr:Hypothetical Protein CGB_C4595C [Cryptococcus gattii WM276]KIR56362.1 hypothetical protein I315_01427 [Cryptococcus gattii Ru294]KIR81994.1 hypothetical protein I306_00865 [Cryptococcus gattii EJB2]KIY36875.1 hypothetical protein I305_00924 [Cryptococcus gattii E566]KJE04005.1 hypothetical protein I311_02136 [Cryptococcus gattii NT-10]ADV21428.1 Hypothetical Protein CGB_C4595C [Cryptococcus gattii WM276]
MAFQPFSPWIPPSIASSSILQRPNFSTREEFLNNVPNSSRSSTDSTWLKAQQYTKTLSPPPQDYSNWKAKRLVMADAKIQQLTLENRRLRQFIVNNYKDQQTSPLLESTLLEMKDTLSDSTTMSNSSFGQGHQHITDAFRADPFAEEDSSVSS